MSLLQTPSPPQTPLEFTGISAFALISLTDAAASRSSDEPFEAGAESPSYLSQLLLDIFQSSPFASKYFRKVTINASQLVNDHVREHNQNPERYRKRMEDPKCDTAVLRKCLEKLKEYAMNNMLFCEGIICDSKAEKSELQTYEELLKGAREAFNTIFGYNLNPSSSKRVPVIVVGDNNIIQNCFNESRRVNIDAFNVAVVSPILPRDEHAIAAQQSGKILPAPYSSSSSAASPLPIIPRSNNPFAPKVVQSPGSVPSRLRATHSASTSSESGSSSEFESSENESSISHTDSSPEETSDKGSSLCTSVDFLPTYASDNKTSFGTETNPLPLVFGDVRNSTDSTHVVHTMANIPSTSPQSLHLPSTTSISPAPAGDSQGESIHKISIPALGLGSSSRPQVDGQWLLGVRARATTSFHSLVAQLKSRMFPSTST